jgi:two-component system sensor kinase FixL
MGEMAAGLAHEINQPLAAITTYAQACQRLLDRGGTPDLADIRDSLAQISRQALRAGEVIGGCALSWPTARCAWNRSAAIA